MPWRRPLALLSFVTLTLACQKGDPPAPLAPPHESASSAKAFASLIADASTAPEAPATPVVSGPRFVGYFDRSDPHGPHFSWPGTRIDLRFDGTSAKVRFLDGSGGHVHFTTIVDGKESRLELRPGEQSYVLATGLAKGIHEITLFRNSEALWGETQLLGFDVDGPMLPVSAPDRRLLFVGDSITGGYGTEGKGPRCGFVSSEENAYRAWGAVAARTLAADVVLLAFSGGGVYRNNDGDRTDVMSARIQRTVPTRKTSPPPEADAPPSAIVINLATNDFALGAPPPAEFEAAYTALIDALHAKYPAAPFVVTLGPMLYGKALAAAREMETHVVAAAHTRGIDAELLELPMQDGHDGFGCQHHPSVTRQASMANDLVAHLKRRLRW
ncbi:SGNH/GDSL hydrolase family protein [soil metagenome]